MAGEPGGGAPGPDGGDDEPDLRLRDLWRLAPRWARLAALVWVALVVAVLALLLVRLAVGPHR